MFSRLFIYFINWPATYFPCLLFQTRYGANCFAKQVGEDGAGSVFILAHSPVVFPLTSYQDGCMPRDSTHIRAC